MSDARNFSWLCFGRISNQTYVFEECKNATSGFFIPDSHVIRSSDANDNARVVMILYYNFHCCSNNEVKNDQTDTFHYGNGPIVHKISLSRLRKLVCVTKMNPSDRVKKG